MTLPGAGLAILDAGLQDVSRWLREMHGARAFRLDGENVFIGGTYDNYGEDDQDARLCTADECSADGIDVGHLLVYPTGDISLGEVIERDPSDETVRVLVGPDTGDPGASRWLDRGQFEGQFDLKDPPDDTKTFATLLPCARDRAETMVDEAMLERVTADEWHDAKYALLKKQIGSDIGSACTRKVQHDFETLGLALPIKGGEPNCCLVLLGCQ